MSAKQAAFLTSRVISLWFMYLAVVTLIQVPSNVYLASAFSGLQNLTGFTHLSSRLFATCVTQTLQGCGEIVLAIIFYRCGPFVLRFLLGKYADAQDAVLDENRV